MAILISQLTSTGAYTLTSNDATNRFIGLSTVAETLNFSGTGNLEILDVSNGDVLNLTSVDTTTATINIKKSGNNVILTIDSKTFTLGAFVSHWNDHSNTFTLGALADGETVTVTLGTGGTPPSLIINRTGDNFLFGTSAITDTDTLLSFATVTTTALITGATDNVGLVTGALSSGDVTDDTSLDLTGTISAGLVSGQVVAIYDGATRLDNATVNAQNWTYTDSRTLNDAQALSYTARVETTAGVQGAASGTFTLTVDTTAPTLSSSTPADNATGVAIANNIVLTFSETVTKGTAGNIVITNVTDNSDTRTIAITDAQISVSGNTVTINPTADLKPGYDYNVQIASGAIQDSAGNSFAGISNATTLNFTTVPNGTRTSPATTESTGNDILNGNQSSILGTAVAFNAANGNDEYVFSAIRVNDALPTANVTISGFNATTGDKLVFDVTNNTSFGTGDANYAVSDNGTDISLIVNHDGNVQLITLTGQTASRANVGGSVESMTELSTFLGTGSIVFI